MLTDERLSEVLDAALIAFDQKGIDGVAPVDLAGMAGVALTEFLSRFTTPDDVFRAIVLHEVVEPLARAAIELPAGPAGDQLRNYCGRAWEIMNTARFAMIYRLLVAEVPAKPALAKFFAEEIAGPIRLQLETIISNGVARAEFRPVAIGSAARALAGSLVTQAFWCNHMEFWGQGMAGVPTRVVPETLSLMLDGLNRPDSRSLPTDGRTK